MNILLTESQLIHLVEEISVDEIATRDKEPYSWGAMHKIYPTSDPTKLIKVGAKVVVDKWYDLFKNNPNLFVKVYKKGITKIKEKNGNNYDINYVMVEKLDTKAFRALWFEFAKALMVYEKTIGQLDHNSFGYYLIDAHDNLDFLIELGISMKDKPGLHDRYIEFLRLILNIEQLKHKPDIHIDQFGIDSTGKIKCLDI